MVVFIHWMVNDWEAKSESGRKFDCFISKFVEYEGRVCGPDEASFRGTGGVVDDSGVVIKELDELCLFDLFLVPGEDLLYFAD